MGEDTELAHSPTASDDQTWDLNPQRRTPEPMTPTLYDITSPKEM